MTDFRRTTLRMRNPVRPFDWSCSYWAGVPNGDTDHGGIVAWCVPDGRVVGSAETRPAVGLAGARRVVTGSVTYVFRGRGKPRFFPIDPD